MKHSIYQQLFTLLLLMAMTMPTQAQVDGRASYYHNSLHGRTMSNGRPYDRNKLTCAHRTLPFGTMLRVTNQANGKQVIVEVTDRGPFIRGRVIDLSYAAAREIGMIAAGVGSIRVEVLPKDINVPYQDDAEYGLPEIEYGMAGVCYEFIPEWKEEQESAHDSQHTHNTQKIQKSLSTQNSQSNQKNQKNQNTQSNQNHQSSQNNQNSTKPQKEGSRGWTDFFNNLKNWGK